MENPIKGLNWNEEQIEKFIKEVMQNMPEYSGGWALDCISWKYEQCRYLFGDPEEDDTGKMFKEVTYETLRQGFEKMVAFMVANPKSALAECTLTGEEPDEVACNWDATCVQALVEFTIYGELTFC